MHVRKAPDLWLTTQAGIYLLLDFHPFLDDPVHVRLLKETVACKFNLEMCMAEPIVKIAEQVKIEIAKTAVAGFQGQPEPGS